MMFVPDAVANNTPTIASAVTLCAVVGQGFLAHFKGRRGKAADTAKEKMLTAIHAELRESVKEQRDTNALLERRVTGVYYIVTGGPDDDGKNGLRQRTVDHESRIRELERTRTA